MTLDEEWRPYPSLDEYEISSLGRYRRRDSNKVCAVRPDRKGYLRTRIQRHGKEIRKYIARAVAEAFLPNFNPALQVDHINQVKTDNRPSNLRMASSGENARNRNYRRRKHENPKGVYTDGRRFRSVIMLNYRSYNLGSFSTEAEAAAAYDAASLRLHGSFASPNPSHFCGEG